MVHINFKRYALYLLRWQLSTPLLALVLYWLASAGKLTGTIVANLIGGLIFFWIDAFIFTNNRLNAQWEVAEKIYCKDCGKHTRGYRLVKTSNYDKTSASPEFRCEECSIKKTDQLRLQGIRV